MSLAQACPENMAAPIRLRRGIAESAGMFIEMFINPIYNDIKCNPGEIRNCTNERRDLVSFRTAENETGNVWQNTYHQAYM